MDNQPAKSSKIMFWAGWVLSVLPMLMLGMSVMGKFSASPEAAEGFKNLGWKQEQALTLAILEIVGIVLYILPPTAVIGAIVLTGYLGGAIATHLRIDEVSHIPIPAILGVVIWLGLYLRDARLRALIPFRT